ncbi:hypothetical protein PMIN04_009218 [Paraphaeosphaeria minitans]
MPTNSAAWMLGPKQQLQVKEAPYPKPRSDEFVVRNRAIAINPIGWTLQSQGSATAFGWIKYMAAGYEVISKSSPRNFDLLKSLGASEVFDYNDPKVVDDVIMAMKGKTSVGPLNAGENSMFRCLDVLGRCQGDKHMAMATYPVPSHPKRFTLLQTIYCFVTSTTSIAVNYKLRGITTSFVWGSVVHSPMGEAVYAKFLPDALANGKFRAAPKPVVVGERLEAIQNAIDLQKKGISAGKVVHQHILSTLEPTSEALPFLSSPALEAQPTSTMPLTLVHTYAADARQTRYLLRNTDDGSISWGHSYDPVSEIKSTPPEDLDRCGNLDPDAFCTKRTTSMTPYHGPLESPLIFIKHHNFIRYDRFEDPTMQTHIKATQEREIWAAEKYRSAPHPNICEYKGVITDTEDRVIATVYRRYDTDLFNLIENSPFLDILASQPSNVWPPVPSPDYIMSAIHFGIRHIHSLGLVHCDIRPGNIFIDTHPMQVVIGDFDGTNTPGNQLQGRFAQGAASHTQGGVVDASIDVGCFEDMVKWLEDCRKRKLARAARVASG